MRLARTLLMTAAIGLLSASANAYDWGSVWSAVGPGFGFGYGFNYSPYRTGQLPVPPYFAVHPPVYYSHPEARPYGRAPFNYGYAPECKCERQRVLVNPFLETVRDQAAPAAPTEHAPTQPVPAVQESATVAATIIVNPFYQAAGQPTATAREQVLIRK